MLHFPIPNGFLNIHDDDRVEIGGIDVAADGTYVDDDGKKHKVITDHAISPFTCSPHVEKRQIDENL